MQPPLRPNVNVSTAKGLQRHGDNDEGAIAQMGKTPTQGFYSKLQIAHGEFLKESLFYAAPDICNPEAMSQENTKSPSSSSQQIEKPKEPSAETKEPKEQSITLPISQLLKWEKKSKQLTNQVKTLTSENQSLKEEIAQLKKKQDEKRKNDNVVQGLEQTIKELQRILDQNMTALNRYKKQNNKLQDDLNLTKQLLASGEAELVGLRDTARDYFLLKQEVNRLENQITTLKTVQNEIEKSKHELGQCKDKIEGKQERIMELSHKLAGASKQIEELIKAKSELEQNLEGTKEQIGSYEKQKSVFDDRVKEYEMQIDDLEKESQLAITKYIQEIKDLKELLLNEKSQREQLEGKYKQHQQAEESRKKRNLEGLEDKDPEYLLTKIEELETQNSVTKYLMNETSSKIALLEQKLKTRSQVFMALAKQHSQRWPNLQQSQGLQYIEKELLQEAVSDKTSLVDTVQRCMIENLRLKSMISTIGSEYNNELRKRQNS